MYPRSEQIERWADDQRAVGDFPRLVASLIIASCPQVTDISMPGGRGVFCGGPDGLVECAVGNAFVPDGCSLWELGTDCDPRAKAQNDYTKRSDSTGKERRESTTFVFATPRRWPGSQEWCEERRMERRWMDVKVVTSCHLENWLKVAPWVAVGFFGGEPGMGVPVALGDCWEEYANSRYGETIDTDLVIAGRSEEANRLAGWFEDSGSQQSRQLWVYGASQTELKDFLAASVYRMPDERRREVHLTRTVFVGDRGAVRSLPRMHGECVVVTPEGEHLPAVNKAIRGTGCRLVVLRVGNASTPPPCGSGHDVLEVGAPVNRGLILAVGRLGWSPEEAAKICGMYGFDYAKIKGEVFACRGN